MDISSFAAATPPPSGDTDPGDLYVDLQSRTLWLGVDEAVNASGYELISDIVGVLAEIDAAELRANQYTDAQLLSRAPLASPVFTGDPRAPTPNAADNDTSLATTAWVKTALAAASSGQFVKGMVMMWSGALTGVPAGWALCDGNTVNGFTTPNLSNRFIFGASVGGKGVGATNPTTSVTTDLQGAFTPVITGYALTVANLPAHLHSFSDSFTTSSESVDHTHAFSDSFSGSTSSAGAHTHPIGYAETNVPDEGGWSYKAAGSDSSAYSGSAGLHAHTFSGSIGGNTGGRSAAHTHTGSVSGNTGNTGSGTAHTHGASAVAGHKHTITQLDLREAIPYYALAFIIKL